MQAIANRAESNGVEKPEAGGVGLVPNTVATAPSFSSTDIVEAEWIHDLRKLPDEMEKLTVVDD